MVQHAISEVGTGNRKTDSLHLIPSKVIFREKFFHAIDPPIDHSLGAELGVCGTLREIQGDRRPVFINPAGLRGGCAAICADKDGFHGMVGRRFLSNAELKEMPILKMFTNSKFTARIALTA
jgi:hypothetical protein